MRITSEPESAELDNVYTTGLSVPIEIDGVEGVIEAAPGGWGCVAIRLQLPGLRYINDDRISTTGVYTEAEVNAIIDAYRYDGQDVSDVVSVWSDGAEVEIVAREREAEDYSCYAEGEETIPGELELYHWQIEICGVTTYDGLYFINIVDAIMALLKPENIATLSTRRAV